MEQFDIQNKDKHNFCEKNCEWNFDSTKFTDNQIDFYHFLINAYWLRSTEFEKFVNLSSLDDVRRRVTCRRTW